MTDSQEIQSRQYGYPYHHLPFINETGKGYRAREVDWGFEYLLYMRKLRGYVSAENPESVLDVGCGDGFLLGSLPTDIKRRVGLDINERALSFGRAGV